MDNELEHTLEFARTFSRKLKTRVPNDPGARSYVLAAMAILDATVETVEELVREGEDEA